MATITFNKSNLAFFTGYINQNENAIIHKNGDKAVSGGTWSSANIFRSFRSASTKSANNEVRAELLKNLGQAFGISGMGRDRDGNTTFSREFMDHLENLLGASFKREDFGIGANGGKVTSGKPLTQRRITAILRQATVVGKIPFSPADYRIKIDAMKSDADAIKDADDAKIVRTTAKTLEKALNFLENTLPTLVEDNPDHELYDPEIDKGNRKAEEKFILCIPPEDANEDQCKPIHEGGKKIMASRHDGRIGVAFTKDELRDYINMKFGFLLHLENIPQRQTDDEFLTGFLNYTKNILRQFIQTAVDLYLGTKGTSEQKEVIRLFTSHNPCMEGWTGALTELLIAKGLMQSDDAKLAVADHTETTKLIDCMAKEVAILEENNPEGRDLGWEDYEPVLMKNLIGLKRPIQGTDGETTLREVTREDILALRHELMTDVLMVED